MGRPALGDAGQHARKQWFARFPVAVRISGSDLRLRFAPPVQAI